MEEPEKKRAKRIVGGRRCMVYGCSNDAFTSGFFMHKMPGRMPLEGDDFSPLQKRWIGFLAKKRKFDTKVARGYARIIICSGHFVPEDYLLTSSMMFRNGLRKHPPDLKEDAVPSVFEAEQPFPSISSSSSSSTSTSTVCTTTTTSSPTSVSLTAAVSSVTTVTLTVTTVTFTTSSSTVTTTTAAATNKRPIPISEVLKNIRSRATRRSQDLGANSRRKEVGNIMEEYEQKSVEEAREEARKAEEARYADILERSKGQQCKTKMHYHKVKIQKRSCRLQARPRSLSKDNMAMKQGIDCWMSLSSTDGEGDGTLQSSHEHDEGNICIKEEGEVEKETCLSIPGSDGLIDEGQLVTQDGLVFTIKQEVDTDMFESLSNTEGQDPSTDQEMVYATIKQEDEKEIFEPITTQGEGGGETEQSIPEGNICIKEEGELEVEKEAHLSIPGSDGLRYEGQLVTQDGLVITIKQEVDTDMFESLSSTKGQDPSTEQETVYATIKQEDEKEIFEPITTQGEGGGETEQSLPEDLDNGQDKIHSPITACSGEKSHPCLHCSKTLTDEKCGEKPYPFSYCDKGFSCQSNLAKHLWTYTGENSYQCPCCDTRFSERNKLTSHLRTVHTGEKRYKCSQCDQRFHHSGHLNRHFRTHSGEKLYQCPNCERRFSEETKLTRHLRTHTGEKSFKCSQCDKGFSHKSTFIRHLRAHTGEKPFKCVQCDKGFSHKGSLILHLRIHSGEKPYQCPNCEKRYSEKTKLTNHLRTHTGETPYRCSYCDKGFSEKSILTSHLRTHTGEKPFKCSRCDKGFSQRGSLMNHLRTHRGEKPYKCSHCDKVFSSNSYLRTHSRTHSGEKPY